MAFGQDAVEQLSRELLGGYNLSTRLLALLGVAGEPLDSRRQEAAVAMIQELSGQLNLTVSRFMLKSGDSSGAAEARTASPQATITKGSIDQRSPANDKRISREELTPHRKVRGEVVTEEITASPFKDGYQWKKYGQKNIQNREFARKYYRCMYSHGSGCKAKKQVQEQDNSSGMFQVTYVNEHTCHQVLPNEPIGASPTLPGTDKNNSTTMIGHFDDPRQHGGNDELENKIMTRTLTMVMGGARSPPPSSVEASELSDPVSYVPTGAHSPSLLDVNVNMDLDETACILCGSPLPPVLQAPAAPSPPPPPQTVQASSSDPAGYVPTVGGYWPTPDPMTIEETLLWCGPPFSPIADQSIRHWGNAPMADARFPDTPSGWPHYS